jgi:DNA-binding NarL/FixJ family response regulator
MKFALVEDQVMFRSMLRGLLIEECKGRVVLEAGSLGEVRSHVAMLSAVDVLLLDIRLPDGDGLDFLDELSRLHMSVPVLLLSSSCEDFVVHRVSRSFAQGFVHKDEQTKVLITAIQMVAGGGTFFSPRFTDRKRALVSATGSFDKKLSPREQQILRSIGAGLTDAEVAAELGISANTAQTHRRNVMEKLDLHSARDVQAYALKAGFTTTDRLK